VYWMREYSLPLLLALSLHALAAWSLYRGWSPDREVVNMIKPQAVMANLLVLEPKAKPTPKPKAAAPKPKAQPQKATPSKPKPDPGAAEKRQAQDAAKKAAEQKAAEQAAKEQARQERLARLSALAETSLSQAITEESANLQAGTAEMVAQSYRLGIYELVRQNWSRPPSARNGMSAKLLVELIPTGEVVGVTVVESSGNAAFDRSAEQAVRAARRFEVPPENAVFESHFRRFYFLFQPEDLLR
jgi:colicin import membrane protein